MMRRRNKKEPIPLLDLAMLAVVAGFFAYSGYTFWNGKPRPPAAASVAAPSRALASLAAPAPAAPAIPETSTHTLTLDCFGSEAPKGLRTQAGLLRVEGKLCGKVKELKGRNLSTQEELQIFARPGKFTSQYFPLAPGLNKIVLEEASHRARAQAFEITRESAR